MSDVEIDVQGLPEVRQMLGEFTAGRFNNRIRRANRAAIKPIRERMRSEGSSGQFPRRFRKTRTRNHRNPIGTSVSPQSPLSTIFEHGAKPHMIGPIHHPGMKARPFIAPVFSAAEHAAESEWTRVMFEGFGPGGVTDE